MSSYIHILQSLQQIQNANNKKQNTQRTKSDNCAYTLENIKKGVQVIYQEIQKMIFPKQQMKIDSTKGQLLNKQALQLIVQFYLTRTKYEDISFLSLNFGSSEEFASEIGSSLQTGLSSATVTKNRAIFGQNQKRPPQKCISFKQCLLKQLYNPFIVVGILFLLACIIYSQIRSKKQLASSSQIILVFQLVTSFLRIFQSYYYSRRLQKCSLEKTKNTMYQVIRNGHLLEIEESEIVVGDIVELGFKQKVPATGIIVSTKSIFVKQNKNTYKQTELSESEQEICPQLKMNLQSCLRKIKSMSLLDLKLSIERENLPSPIVLRGSQLLKGSTYTIIILSVDQESLLKKHGYNKEDKFESHNYNQWVSLTAYRWKIWGLILVILINIILPLIEVTQTQLDLQKRRMRLDLFFDKYLEIAVLILVLNYNGIKFYIDTLFVKLLIDLKIIDNYCSFFTLERILCNQRNVLQEDQIKVQQIAICEKMDLLSIEQLTSINKSTCKIIYKIDNIFNLKIKQNQPRPQSPSQQKQINLESERKQEQKFNRIIHIFKKDQKVISYLYALDNIASKTNNNDGHLKQSNKKLQHVRQFRPGEFLSSHSVSKQEPEKEKKGSHNMLKLPKIFSEFSESEQKQNLKQLLQTKCQIKTKSVLDGLVSLAQKGLRTYYYQFYDLKSLDHVHSIVQNGKVVDFNPEYLERMAILARKIKIVYNLIPVMIGFSDGSYHQRPFHTLVCIIGVKINQQNQVIDRLIQLQQQGVKSLIFTSPSASARQKQLKETQKQLVEEYRKCGWLSKQEEDNIYDMEKLKKQMKRLVCRSCWISNCDCKDKTQDVTNIQPFIQIADKIRMIYNVDDEGLNYLESAYRQLQNNCVSINSANVSALDLIESVFLCLHLVKNLKNCVILFYVIAIIYFCVGALCWIMSKKYISPIQLAIQYMYITVFVTFIFLLQSKLNKLCQAKQQPQQRLKKNQIKVINNKKTIIYFMISLLTIIFSGLLNRFHYILPEYRDDFDTVIQKLHLDPFKCKYTLDDAHVIGNFNFQHCYLNNTSTKAVQVSNVPSQYQVQYSRLSTIITYYLFVTMWLLIIFNHFNIKSIVSILFYLIFLFVYTLALQLAPHLTHTYSEGLAWQHYLIVSLLSISTICVGYLIGYLFQKLPVFKYVKQQTQTIISFKSNKKNNKNSYAGQLKKYWISKKWEILTQEDKEKNINLFNSAKL